MVKAGFWTDGELLRWHRDKRSVYQSLWALAEDSCCIEDDPFEWKLNAWPSPEDADITVDLLSRYRDELVAAGKAIPYENGKKYLYLPEMAKHEHPRNPQEPDLPLPPWVTFTTTGDGRNKRVVYTHADCSDMPGNREQTVQSTSGNRNTSPVLSCPVLPSPVQGGAIQPASSEKVLEAHSCLADGLVSTETAVVSAETPSSGKPPFKVIEGDTTMPPCMLTPLETINPPYSGTCIGFIVHGMEQQFGEIPSSAEIQELKSLINEGCIPGCDGSHPIDCALLIYMKLKTKGATRFATSRLWKRCILEDRMEARQHERPARVR